MALIKAHPIRTLLFSLVIFLIVFHQWWLSQLGHFLVHQQEFAQAEVTIVLNTGAEIYPRLIEAADLYKQGKVKFIAINGNRKTDVLRKIETMGYQPAQPWYEEHLRILKVLGVPREKVLPVNAEDVYDTVSEAQVVGTKLIEQGFKQVVVTTSKSHTRRAAYIWNQLFNRQLTIYSNSAGSDPYDPEAWWKEGRQIRWVLAEYGGWFFLYWKKWFSVA